MTQLPSLNLGDTFESGSLQEWQNVIDEVRALSNLRVSAPLTMTKTTEGIALGMRPLEAFARPAAGQRQFEVKSEEHDYVVCTPVGQSSATTTNVAKPPLLRRVPANEAGERVRDDIEYTYTDAKGERTATLGSTPNAIVEIQHIEPRYIAGDIVIAALMTTGINAEVAPESDDDTGPPIVWQEIESGRENRTPLEEDQ